MQQKFGNCLFTLIFALIVMSFSAMALAQESASTNKNTAAPAGAAQASKSSTPAATASTKSATANTGKVALVNGSAISREQFDNALTYQKNMYAMQGGTISDDQIPALKYQVLDNLISTELLFQESKKSGVKVEEKEVNEAYESNRQKANFKTDAEFEEALKKSNKSLASYKAELKQGLAINRFIKNKFYNKTTISDSEAKSYYDNNPSYFQQPAQVKISHIMIKFPADQTKKDEAKKKIEDVKKRLKAGDDFEALAKDISEDTNSKNNGGELGYFSKDELPKSFETAAFALKTGESSDIVESDSGYHIIKLNEKKDAKTTTYEESKDNIINSLKNVKVNTAVNGYLTELKNQSTIQTFPINK
jgi:peptidyl-prolyl cis-trans isomerase C